MKLYYMPGACSLSPHIVLNEAGLPFDKVKVDGKTKSMDGGGDYRGVNPLGYVPLLELDDGTRISEGPAIVQYIADKVPAKNLAPATGTMERTKLQSWLNFISSEMHKGFSPLFNPTMPEARRRAPGRAGGDEGRRPAEVEARGARDCRTNRMAGPQRPAFSLWRFLSYAKRDS